MTEQEWLAATDPERMLEFLRGKASERKLRLTAVASCYRIWACLIDERSRAAVEAADRFADGRTDSDSLVAARTKALRVLRLEEDASLRRSDLRHWSQWASETALSCAASNAYPPQDRPASRHEYFTTTPVAVAVVVAARRLWEEEEKRLERGEDAAYHGDDWSESLWERTKATEYHALADLVREVFGNPFHPVTVDPTCLTPTVLALAQGIYADRAFDRLPILADALADAGCEDETLLNHLRGPGPHVRGCFALDLILGKE